ncbi:hypothetical protein PENSPDRAFT_668913 [Peniophora sp. CONT]|nr:hypothetical protein PENSPDRAFT_668913 [Peniophora sp. CONT]
MSDSGYDSDGHSSMPSLGTMSDLSSDSSSSWGGSEWSEISESGFPTDTEVHVEEPAPEGLLNQVMLGHNRSPQLPERPPAVSGVPNVECLWEDVTAVRVHTWAAIASVCLEAEAETSYLIPNGWSAQYVEIRRLEVLWDIVVRGFCHVQVGSGKAHTQEALWDWRILLPPPTLHAQSTLRPSVELSLADFSTGLVYDFISVYEQWQEAERKQLVLDQRWFDCFVLSGPALRAALHEELESMVGVRADIYEARLMLVPHSPNASLEKDNDVSCASVSRINARLSNSYSRVLRSGGTGCLALGVLGQASASISHRQPLGRMAFAFMALADPSMTNGKGSERTWLNGAPALDDGLKVKTSVSNRVLEHY